MAAVADAVTVLVAPATLLLGGESWELAGGPESVSGLVQSEVMQLLAALCRLLIEACVTCRVKV